MIWSFNKFHCLYKNIYALLYAVYLVIEVNKGIQAQYIYISNYMFIRMYYTLTYS